MITSHVRKTAPRRRHIRPILELLEDRCVPASTIRTWTGNALMNDGKTLEPKWDTADNWQDSSGNPGAPQSGDDLRFPTLATNFDSENNLPTGTEFGNLQIDGNYTISGAAIELSKLSTPVLVKTAAGTVTVKLPMKFGNSSQIEVQNADTTLQLEGVISGSSGLTKIGPGVLTLSAANDYTGATNIQAGTLQKGKNVEALPDNSTVTVADGAGLNLAGFSEVVGALAGSGNVNLGPGDVTLAVGANEQGTGFAGAISGNPLAGRRVSGSVHKVGAGVWELGGTIAADHLRLANGIFVLSGHLDDNIAVLIDDPARLVVPGKSASAPSPVRAE